ERAGPNDEQVPVDGSHAVVQPHVDVDVAGPELPVDLQTPGSALHIDCVRSIEAGVDGRRGQPGSAVEVVPDGVRDGVGAVADAAVDGHGVGEVLVVPDRRRGQVVNEGEAVAADAHRHVVGPGVVVVVDVHPGEAGRVGDGQRRHDVGHPPGRADVDDVAAA